MNVKAYHNLIVIANYVPKFEKCTYVDIYKLTKTLTEVFHPPHYCLIDSTSLSEVYRPHIMKSARYNKTTREEAIPTDIPAYPFHTL